MNVGDAAAAGGDGHTLARLHAIAQGQPRELNADFRRHVRNLRRLKFLTHPKHLGIVGHDGVGSSAMGLLACATGSARDRLSI